MGCVFSADADNDSDGGAPSSPGGGAKRKLHKPKPWKHREALTREELDRMREEFWDTAPHYGGHREIWDALKAAVEADHATAQAIIDSAGIILESHALNVCYDERGAKYELPNYVISDPENLKR